jgi:protein-disulfide isomerase
MNKLSVQIVAVLAFVGIALGALYYGGVFGNSQNGEISQTERTAKQVEILKYSDYSCPACAAYAPLEKQLKAEFGDMVQFGYRHFPLESFPHSELAAYAAEAARNQGKFLEMHDMLFNRQQEWSPTQANARQIFMDYAEMLELDLEQFEADLDNEEIHAKVESNLQEGIRRQVNATPTYFVDGHKIRQNPQSYEQFKSIVELYMYRNN